MTTNNHQTTVEYTIPRHEDNVAGSWYVNEECIECRLCSETAPENFRLSDAGDHNIVFKQPSTPEEVELAKEAMEDCPAESIICED